MAQQRNNKLNSSESLSRYDLDFSYVDDLGSGANFSGGLLKVDKPAGLTSFDVIRLLRKKLNIKKMGHSGTLDPMATGLLIIGVNEGTKRLQELIGLPKVYEAEITLGIKTDTSDITGTVLDEVKDGDGLTLINLLTKDVVERALLSMKGDLSLPVSIFSAIKKDGKPLYKYAREGEGTGAVPHETIRTMTIRNVQFISYENKIVKAVFDVSSGTYIRSLAEELGKRLGTIATLSALRRISIGEYKL